MIFTCRPEHPEAIGKHAWQYVERNSRSPGPEALATHLYVFVHWQRSQYQDYSCKPWGFVFEQWPKETVSCEVALAQGEFVCSVGLWGITSRCSVLSVRFCSLHCKLITHRRSQLNHDKVPIKPECLIPLLKPDLSVYRANQETEAFGVVMLFALDKSLSYFECHGFLPWKCTTCEFWDKGVIAEGG